MSPSEARLMDPQQRIFLEVVEQCLQNAGYSRDAMNGSHTGVYVGVARFDYASLIADSNDRTHGYANTGNTHAILANRVSYIYGWTGESLAIDSACSSSSLAIHKAVKAISSGECDQAVAGGVNLILSPTTFISNRKMGLLSNESTVRSFDQTASGYLSGEGAGAVLLKPLSRALADGDFVYAVIKGSAVRHGGNGASLTTPNPKMQAQVIRDAYADAGISPSQASYIEAQGAGNVMGDSAELSAYHEVFDSNEAPGKSIGIGSIKGNIGHLETASGVVALIKVLLAMKNQQIPPMLHASECRPYFSMDKGPFYFPSHTHPWKSSTNHPTVASLHNFGYGGVNVHLVLQEYSRPAPLLNHRSERSLIVLSAGTKNQLTQYLKSIRDYLTNPEVAIYGAESTLADLAFTLFCGRPQLSSRLHFIVSSKAELIGKIDHYLREGQVSEIKSIDLKSIPVSEDGQPILEDLSRDEKLLTLAAFWHAGNIIDWQRHQLEPHGCRTPFPCPDFDRAIYWPVNIDEYSEASRNPMLGHHCATRAQPQYKIEFTGSEFFFADHRVGEDKILPGVAHLEMARCSAEDAGLNVSVMKNIMWGQPIVIRDQNLAVDCSIRVKDEAAQSHYFEVHSGENFYCKGTVFHTESSHSTPNLIRLETLLESFNQVLEHDAIYHQFGLRGLHLGPAFRPLRKVWFNSEQALGQLDIPSGIHSSSKGFYLHPSIMDGALQTITSLVSGDLSNRLYLPFSLGQICIYAPVNEPCYALSERIQSFTAQDDSLLQFNITLIAGDGRILAELTEFCVRLWHETPEQEEQKGGEQTTAELILAQSVSQTVVSDSLESIGGCFDHVPSVLAIDIGQYSVISERLPSENNGSPHVLHWRMGEGIIQDRITAAQFSFKDSDDINPCIEELLAEKTLPSCILLTMPATSENPGGWIFERVFRLFKGLVSKVGKETQIICVDMNKTISPWSKAILSLLRSLSKESLLLQCRYVHFQGVTENSLAIEAILAEFSRSDTDDICIDAGRRKQEYLRQLDVVTDSVICQQPDSYDNSPIKHGGVYLITGGMGKLGVIFARYLAAHGDVRLVLAGSSPIDEDKLKVIHELESKGGSVRYFRTDFSNRDSVSQMLSAVQACFGQLNGIFHCAGRTDDNYLINKSLTTTASVINPKAIGAVLLDELTADHALDFFVMSSSLASVVGNAGQTDYAYANGFLDSFATYRNSQVEGGKRSGATLSINWPLWRDGGMTLATAQLEWIEQNLGLLPMPASEGLKALNYGLLSGLSRLVVLYGHKHKLINQFNLQALEEAPQASLQVSGSFTPDTFQSVRETLLQLFAEKSRIPTDSIVTTKHLSSYGMDSMMVMELTRSLENDFNDLPGTLFFEHPTIDAVASYLCEKYRGNLDSMLSRRFKEPSRQVPNTSSPVEEGQATLAMLLQSLPVKSQIQNISVSPEIKLEVITMGQGSPLLFIPGFGMTAQLWLRQLEYFVAHHRIIIIHPPAHGKSDASDDVSPSKIAQYFVQVLKAMNIHESVDVVGTSYGSQIAQCLAARHSAMVNTLTIANGFYELKDRFSPTDPFAGGIISFGGELWLEFNEQSLQENEKLHKDYLFIKDSISLDSVDALTYIDSFTKTSTREILKDIKVPTLMISGTGDRLSTREVNNTMHDLVSGSQFYSIEGAGHFACVTHHREFNETLNHFISRRKEIPFGELTHENVD
nr:alpha/beta fold hydrolase [Photobacterium sp. GJ3]